MNYRSHLERDKKLAAVLGNQVYELSYHPNIPLRLIASIISQQLSTKVADVIYRRFLELYNGEEPTSKQILSTDPLVLRSIGCSNAKVMYVHNVARFCVENNITDALLHKMSNEEIIELLTQIKGVGKWTVEMLLMFTLGREDVFPIDDLGIRNAMIKIYKLKTADKKLLNDKLLKISKKWSPYRTYACRHLWAWRDNVPAVE
jgi:DNA-3-methyladenine glycosylase II